MTSLMRRAVARAVVVLAFALALVGIYLAQPTQAHADEVRPASPAVEASFDSEPNYWAEVQEAVRREVAQE